FVHPSDDGVQEPWKQVLQDLRDELAQLLVAVRLVPNVCQIDPTDVVEIFTPEPVYDESAQVDDQLFACGCIAAGPEAPKPSLAEIEQTVEAPMVSDEHE